MKHVSEYPHLRAAWIKEQKRMRQDGISRTCRVYNYQMMILITLATQELFKGGYNQEVRDVVLALNDALKRGYFNDDHV